ncbi:putative integrase domain protein [Orientia tsutsugamushi str. Gilliam]|uniref:Putative integrase domain protein n=1 Tax=Orientia tsutsugamushi str. Gilliam TaxID=1359184 RepID=A0A0F3MHS5_ORITS|nr:hypothetical protein [Orientia tsutsugamushi]KJV54109.1 putative integrase domain protein [Orientia tsutsugamushi str. Gilliam]
MSSISSSSKFIKQALNKINISEEKKLEIIHHPDIIGLKLKISWVVRRGRVRKTWVLEQKFKTRV